MTAPHPLRCGTCKFTHWDKCSAIKRFIGDWSKESIVREITSEIGCASHSSTTSAERVLKELMDFCVDLSTKIEITPAGQLRIVQLRVVMEKIKELQQQEREMKCYKYEFFIPYGQVQGIIFAKDMKVARNLLKSEGVYGIHERDIGKVDISEIDMGTTLLIDFGWSE